MSSLGGSRRFASALAGAVVAATVASWIALGDPVVALLPLLATVAGWLVVTAAPHRTAIVLLFLAIVVDNPKEQPAMGRWSSPLKPLGVLLYENLNNITGVRALRFCVMDLLLAALFVLALVRERRPDAVRTPPVLRTFLAAAWLAILWIEVWGLLRGGDFKASLWQARELFWAPVIAYILAAGLRGPRDHAALGAAVVGAAIIKSISGVYFYAVVCRSIGFVPSYATTHSDTVLFVTAVVIALATWLERRTPAAALKSVAILTVVGLGLLVNQRRVAYVGLAGAILALRFVLPADGLRRMFDRLLLVTVPAAALYVVVGSRFQSSLFDPAREVATLFTRQDESSLARDIENYNLLMTWKNNVLLGSGFGHEYKELTHMEGLESIFPAYRYVAHNSVLWLEAVGGFVGFTAFWMLLPAVGYFAARSHRFATSPVDRAAALTALSVVPTVAAHAYGDMGLVSWTAMFALAASLAVASKLAVASGAFPLPPDR